MNNEFKAVSLSHKNTPLQKRELIALKQDDYQYLLYKINKWSAISDILILSTCNRTEVYYSSPIDYSDAIIEEIVAFKGLLDFSTDYQHYFTRINDPYEAIEHLFYVSMGLESQVVGDMQISNQVKNAYQLSADEDVAGPFLHRLMHTIFFTNKRVVQETPFRSGAASTSYASVELIEQFASEITNPKVLVLGVGEIGADVCRNLQSSFVTDVTIVNRTYEKAEALAAECNFQAIPFEDVYEAVAQADVIVSSIPKEDFITKEFISQLEIFSFKYFIDLSVPRSVQPEVEELTGVLVYNIDKIQNRASKALQKRMEAIPDVKSIIAMSIQDFQEWAKEMEISPTLQRLKRALEQIRREELERYAKKMNEEETSTVEKVTKSMMQKILKLPALQLKAACKRGEAETLIDVLNDLFALENQPEKLIK